MDAQVLAQDMMDEDWPPEFKQQLKDAGLDFLGDETDSVCKSTFEESDNQFQSDLVYNSFLATPMIQVFSVSIETNIDNDRPYEIYGSIRGTEGQDTSFHLYDRGCEDAETIWKFGTLSLISPENGISLIGPENGIIFPFMGIKLDISLKDRIRDVDVIKGCVNLDSVIEEEEDSFDKLLKAVIQGEYGIAYVYYAIFQFGVLGIMEVTITDLKGDQFADICGSLVAGYGNSKKYCNNDDELENLKSTLLKIPSDRPMRVMIENPITLSRCVVVAPAYSSMKVEANFWDSMGKIIIGDNVEIEVHRGDSIAYIESQYACLRVKVKWRHAYVQLYRKVNAEAKNKLNEDVDCMKMHKKPRVVCAKPLQSTSDMSRIATLCVGGKTYRPYCQVEVFSVLIGGITKEISALCGLIYIDIYDKYHIYNKDESSFELLDGDSFASIEGPTEPIRNMEFSMALNLKDPVQNLEVSNGSMGWHVGHLEMNMSWYDKHLCSVIRGKDGFAAVHYIIYGNAFSASIEARIISDSPEVVHVYVCGNLWTQYSGFDYSKEYQKKYYRHRLLNLPQNKSVKLKTGSKIPLCKSVVAVPVGSSLFIEAKLRITSANGKSNVVSGIEVFENNMSSNCKYIKGEDHKIELSVNFF